MKKFFETCLDHYTDLDGGVLKRTTSWGEVSYYSYFYICVVR